jgi:hypothetical protein
VGVPVETNGSRANRKANTEDACGLMVPLATCSNRLDESDFRVAGGGLAISVGIEGST